MKLYLTKISTETAKLMSLNKDIDYNKLVGLLLDEWVQANLKAQIPAS